MVKQWAPIYLNKNQKFEFINELSSGNIPALILKKAFSLKTCKKNTEKILGFNYISSGPGIEKKIGVSLNSFINKKGAYFEKTKFIDKKLEQYFSYNEDPRILMQNLLSTVFTMETRVAKENNLNPRDWTKKNIATMKNQLQLLGLSIDWELEISTCDASSRHK